MSKGKYYITTAIAYTSGKPHIGNTYEIILADAIARYKKLRGGVMCGRYRLLILLIETISFRQGLLRYNLCPKQFQYSSFRQMLFQAFYVIYK